MNNTITKDQYNDLVSRIYRLLMDGDNMGMGEMGEAKEAAENTVNDWLKANDIKVN